MRSATFAMNSSLSSSLRNVMDSPPRAMTTGSDTLPSIGAIMHPEMA